jgi:ssDNA thymidine ADP-ribosyltransferase, DarT
VSDVEEIRQEAELREVSRLAHFTPLRNLVHIATDDEGLRSTLSLKSDERATFNQQDLTRLDGFPDHISCAIEYPNAYYFRKKKNDARGIERIFPNWVCLLIEPHHLWRETTLLCPHNAAGWNGVHIASGLDTFKSMFAAEVETPQAIWKRRKQPSCCPTDAQAEVLVHRHIPLGDVQGVVVETPIQAADTYEILKQLNAPIESLPFIVCPGFYEPTELALGLAAARTPAEAPWHPDSDGEVEATDG